MLQYLFDKVSLYKYSCLLLIDVIDEVHSIILMNKVEIFYLKLHI